MKRFFIFYLIAGANLYAQESSSVRLLEYRVEASLDEQQSKLTATVAVWLRITRDGTDNIHFRIPSNIEINAVRDIDDDRFSLQRSTEKNAFFLHTIMLPAQRSAGDSIFVKIEFEELFDSSSHALQFVNQREFLLQYSNDITWLPQFDDQSTDHASVALTVKNSFRLVGSFRKDSVSDAEGNNVWYSSRNSLTSLHDFFSICGSTSITGLKKQSPDSLTSVSFFIDTIRFHPWFADSLLTYLYDAARYFKEITGTQTTGINQSYCYIGEATIERSDVRTTGAMIDRNSPAYTQFDSSVFVRSVKNVWLVELARRFSLSRTDSTALFDDGWAGYLATRYIVSRFPNPEIERRERLDLMINALSFFPTNPLKAGRISGGVDNENLSFKGRYFFLMTEYLLGKESFTSVIKKLYDRFSKRSITIPEFQTLCEEEYGSPLDWFFQEWLYRSTAPEFAIQWSSERTQRGVVLTKLIVEQRGDVFTMPVTVFFTVGSKKIPKRILVDQFRQEFRFTFNSQPTAVELDPNFSVLRWLLDIRILAHARSSRLFRIYNKNISSAEREAQLTLDLDPVNATGSAPIAHFSLGKLAVLENDLERAKEHFLKAMQSKANEESSIYPLLSLIRFGNILEMEGRRNEALPLYQRAASEGKRNPSLFAPAISEAEKYIREQFTSTEEFWYGIY
ncbi:MAG: hypothetical protein HYV29_01455 [Ignavibacteriales bacterium]|nr:hypothetical protein [Ignavibacteriales bacterium]